MSIDSQELWLVWQDSKTRQRHKIGKLWVDNDKYYFRYDKDGLASARQYGYRCHPSFPVQRIYKSNELFSPFRIRLPNKERQDYVRLLRSYCANPQNSDFAILAATGGKLATDNYEFVNPLDSCDNSQIHYEFYVAGWRYASGPEIPHEDLRVGTLLKLVPEPENEYDKFAIQVRTANDAKIGYMPAIYSATISSYIAKGCELTLTVLNFEPNAESSLVLKVRLVCDGVCSV